MKKFTITKSVFDQLLYPCIACATHSDFDGIRMNNQVLLKLESKSSEGPPELGGTSDVPPLWNLVDDEATFYVENDEATYIVKKLIEGTSPDPSVPGSGVQGRVTRQLISIIDSLKDEKDVLGELVEPIRDSKGVGRSKTGNSKTKKSDGSKTGEESAGEVIET